MPASNDMFVNATTKTERLVWEGHENGYASGLDRGVLYPEEGPGVAWSGLISVEDSHVGGEIEPLYIDGIRYHNLPSGRNYQANLTAYSYPEEFAPCNGELEVQKGLILTRQARQRFGFSYRVLIGDGVGYKIHLVYNALATPTARGYRTLTNTPTPNNASWQIDAVPTESPAPRPTSHFILDSTVIDPDPMEAIEGLLYGTDTRKPYLPTMGQIVAITTNWDPQIIIPNYVSGLSTLTDSTTGDVTETDDEGVYIVLPKGRLAETSVKGIFQLTELP